MLAYEHYAYATVAVLGTALAVWLVIAALHSPRLMERAAPAQGITGPFINILGVLFGLTLAFIGNDTWSARDRAMDAVFREADGLRSLALLAETLPEPLDAEIGGNVTAYGAALVDEWPALSDRRADDNVAQAGDALLSSIARPGIAAEIGVNLQALMLEKAMEIRADHDLRVSLSQTHLNPLKWLGMAFLGFLTLVAIAVVHLDKPRAGTLALIVFAVAAAPSAAIVLVQGNPFQAPAAVSPAPIADVLARATP